MFSIHICAKKLVVFIITAGLHGNPLYPVILPPQHSFCLLWIYLHASSPFVSLHPAGCDVQPLHVICYLSQDRYRSTATIECLRNHNLNSTTCAVNGTLERPCTLPLEYTEEMLGSGSHFVDMTFTDECGQVEMERVFFNLEQLGLPGGIIIRIINMHQD